MLLGLKKPEEVPGAEKLNAIDEYAARIKASAAMDRILAKEKKIGELNARRQWLINVRIPQLMAGIEDELAALIIRNYYFTDATMWEVAELMHVSYATCYRYRYMGERDMQKVLDAES